MAEELKERVRKALAEAKATEQIKSELVTQGFMEEEVIEALQQAKGVERTAEEKHNHSIFTWKEIFDRMGYGFASIQFINILFNIVGASLFLVGVINGLKTVLSLVISSFLQEYSKVRKVSNSFMGWAGIVFGWSFLFIAVAVILKDVSPFWSLTLFSVSLLIGSISVVTYGDLYERLFEENLKKERLGHFLLRISHYGVLITSASFLVSGFLFDRFPIFNAVKVPFFGKTIALYGYFISFEITAICFILSGYLLHFVKERKGEPVRLGRFIRQYSLKMLDEAHVIFSNRYLLILLVAGSITGLVQILGNSYYGIFIYNNFNHIFFGGFLNVAFIFTLAIIVSFLGPAISAFINRSVGLAPTLVFGTLLVAMMPLVSAYNPHFLGVTFANAISVIGSSIMGMGQGLLVRKLLSEEHRKLYFAGLGIAVVIPFIVLIPIGAWVAHTAGLQVLFKVLALTLLMVAAPLYFILVVLANKQRL